MSRRQKRHPRLPPTHLQPLAGCGSWSSDHCAPLRSRFCSPLSGNYSPGCAFGSYRTKAPPLPPLVGGFSSCCSSPYWFPPLPGLEAAGSCSSYPSWILHSCSSSAASLSLGNPQLSLRGLTPGAASPHPARTPPRGARAKPILPDSQIWPPDVAGTPPPSWKLLPLARQHSLHCTLPPPRRLPRYIHSARVYGSAALRSRNRTLLHPISLPPSAPLARPHNGWVAAEPTPHPDWRRWELTPPFIFFPSTLSLHFTSSGKGRELSYYWLGVSPPVAVCSTARPVGNCSLACAGNADDTGEWDYESP